MNFLIWLRNVTVARHVFIFITITIVLFCLITYIIFLGEKNPVLTSAVHRSIVILYAIHFIWIISTCFFHLYNKEFYRAVIKIILCAGYVVAVYYLNELYLAICLISK